MIELWFLIISVILLTIYLYFTGKKNAILPGYTKEGFEDNTFLQACPSGYKSFYHSDGNMLCCDGDIVANKCTGQHQCTLNGKGTEETPLCVTFIQEDYKVKAKSQCPKSNPSYFEDSASKKKGCTNGSLNQTLTGPKTTSQSTCMIYDTQEENDTHKDSCANQKELEAFPCFGKDCTKELVQTAAGTPVKVAISFTDGSGMHRVAYTRATMQRFLDASNPRWRDQGIDLTKNISVAEVAKAYYVDRTMSQDEIQV